MAKKSIPAMPYPDARVLRRDAWPRGLSSSAGRGTKGSCCQLEPAEISKDECEGRRADPSSAQPPVRPPAPPSSVEVGRPTEPSIRHASGPGSDLPVKTAFPRCRGRQAVTGRSAVEDMLGGSRRLAGPPATNSPSLSLGCGADPGDSTYAGLGPGALTSPPQRSRPSQSRQRILSCFWLKSNT